MSIAAATSEAPGGMRATRICCAALSRVRDAAIGNSQLNRAVEPGASGFGAVGRNSMNDEGRRPGALDSAFEPEGMTRDRRARRRPYGFVRPGGRRETDRYSGPTYAALDLGTNNCRLLVARPNGDSFRVIDAFSRIIRLGEGVSKSGRISDGAIGRAVEALAICRDKMRHRGVTRARLIATEACRAAENGAEFRSRIAEDVGLELEIIDRETEAILAATGCTPLFDPDADGVILFDIGGGSSELVWLGRSLPSGRGPPLPQVRAWVSLPVGVVTLAERHGGHSVTREAYAGMVAEVAGFLQSFAREHGGMHIDRVHLLGTSGTVTTIAGVHLALARYDRRRVDGCWIASEQATQVIERLLGMSYQDRVANPCIGAERADLVLAGCAILDAIRNAFPCRRLRVADRGLREGMLVQMMRKDGIWGSDGPGA
jgi:exopolyphosphatase/guanosine-5'-triphosphate,3'-diphosphate pyrophosphatase